MLLHDFMPCSEVQEFVQCYRIVHFNFDNVKDIPFKAYPPKPEQCLHFFLRDFFAIQKSDGTKEIQPSVMFAAQRTTLVNQYPGRNFIDVQIVFQPTAVFRLTGIPAYELVDRYVDADCIFSKHTQVVIDQLRCANGYPALIHIIESFAKRLINHVNIDAVPFDFVSNQLRRNYERQSIDELAKQSCLCTKQFERKFLERVGVNPKTFTRLIRLNKAFNLKNRYPSKTWPELSITSGYQDYQHLVKDYKAFTGMLPADLHKLEANSPESVLELSKALYYRRWQNDHF